MSWSVVIFFFTFHSLDYLTDNLTNIQMLVMNNSNFAF